ncbi:MAG: MATE family efflux transporter [Deltaproteobacteria bacterium]|nr:MATE family efflux transporter [Deltaproteobacteria bacterium]HCH67018.1 MATE family efflux transporter [Deltaproteobacteria bacterium]
MTPVTTRAIIQLAVPAAASVLLNNLYRVIDQYAVQWLGPDAQAAVGACTFVLIALYAVFAWVSAGTGPLMARAVGSGDPERARKLVGNAVVGSVFIGIVALLLLGLLAAPITALVGLDGDAATAMITYLRWLAVCGLPLAIAPTVDSIFVARGNTQMVMVLQGGATVLNACLNPLLIYGLELGIGGAALATGLSHGMAVVMGLVFVMRRLEPARSDFRLDRTLGAILRMGGPMASNTLLYAGVYWALMSVAIQPLGSEVYAALGIGFSVLEGFTWPVFWGFSLAVSSLVGRYLGAGMRDEARRTYAKTAWFMVGMGLVAAALFRFGAESLTARFSDDPTVLRHAVLYAQILAYSQVFVALEALAEGVLGGAGDTPSIFWWSAPVNLLRVPLAWVAAFPLGYGAMGIWWAINLTTVIKCAGKWVAVYRGRWARTGAL